MYKIRFKSVKYEYETLPKCNICESLLILSNHLESCRKDSPFLKIIKCSNEKCKSNINKLKKNELYKAFLPKDISNEKIESVKSNLIKTNRLCVDSWLNKGYSIEDAKKEISKIQLCYSLKVKPENRVKITKQFYKNKGLSDEEIRLKTLTPTSLDFWINKGYKQEEAKKKVVENQKYAASKIDHSKIVKSTQLEYWIKKYDGDIEKAKKYYKKRQTTFSKKICIKKYGKKNGLIKWTKRQEKWLNTLHKNGNMKIGYSKISQIFFNDIKKYYNDCSNIFFATNNREMRINSKNNGVFMYDFTDEKSKKIIEFNGDLFHANPNIFEKNDYPNPFKKGKGYKASDIWKRDKEKKELAELKGYDVLYVWESEIRKVSKEKYEKILLKCLKFLNIE